MLFMNYTLNLGSWGSIFAVPADVVDKYIKIAGSAQLKVLLWILRHSGEPFDTRHIASQLNMGEFDVRDCIEFWVSFGILAVNGSQISPPKADTADNAYHTYDDDNSVNMNADVYNIVGTPAVPETETSAATQADVSVKTSVSSVPVSLERTHDTKSMNTRTESKPFVKAESTAKEIQKPQEKLPEVSAARPVRPDSFYVAKRMNEDSEMNSLLNEAQYLFGRPVSPNENAGIVMLHDNEGLPGEVILMLISYGLENNMGWKYMEKMGEEWAREGVVSIELADKKISELEEKKEAWRKIQKLLGLEYRKPSSKEEVIYTDWLVKWKFSDDMIKYAYDKCIEAIGKYQLKYMNSILQRWYTGGIKTLEQAKKDTEQYAQKAKKTVKGGASDTGGLSQSGSSNSSFDMDDLQGLSMFSD